MLRNGKSTKSKFFAVWVIVNFLTMVQQKHGFYQSTLFERNRIIFYYSIYQDIPLQVRIVTMNNLIKLICTNVKDVKSIIKRRKKQENLQSFQQISGDTLQRCKNHCSEKIGLIRLLSSCTLLKRKKWCNTRQT